MNSAIPQDVGPHCTEHDPQDLDQAIANVNNSHPNTRMRNKRALESKDSHNSDLS